MLVPQNEGPRRRGRGDHRPGRRDRTDPGPAELAPFGPQPQSGPIRRPGPQDPGGGRGPCPRRPRGRCAAQNLEALAKLGAPRIDPERNWTLITCQNADSNQARTTWQNVNQMEAGLPDKGVEVIALLDRSKEYDHKEGDWTDARVFRVRRDADMEKINSELLAQPGELNLGDPEVLKTLVTAAIKAFPAKHYAVFLSGHGSGWAGMIYDDDVGGSKHPGFLTIAECRQTLREALDAAGVPKLDMLIFDMCMMGQIESAVEFRDVTDILRLGGDGARLRLAVGQGPAPLRLRLAPRGRRPGGPRVRRLLR